MGWGEGLGGLPFPCPSPKKHRAGQGRGVHPRSLLPSPRSHQPLGPASRLGTWFGSCRVGLRAPGLRTCEPSLCGPDLFLLGWGGMYAPFLLFRVGGVTSFIFSSLYLPLPHNFLF